MDGQDDLSEITGIGQARARWLKKTFGVRRFRDLADLSPDDIEHKLKAEGRERVSRKTIESWVTQARVRASEEKSKPPVAGLKDSRGRAAGEPEWEPVTSFVVEFQSRKGKGAEQRWRTSVHHMERDLGKTWAGIACDELCRWMTDQLRAAGGPAVPDVAPDEAEIPGPPVGAESTVAEEAHGHLALAPGRPRLALRAHVVNGNGVGRANLIRIDKPWAVVFNWSLEDGTPDEESDEWQLDVLLKPVGPGKPLRVRESPVHLPVSRPRIDDGYRYRLEVPAGAVTSSHVHTPYRASATIMYRSKTGDRVIAADLGLLRFYQSLVAAGRRTSLIAGLHKP
jgi:hypothetical protein